MPASVSDRAGIRRRLARRRIPGNALPRAIEYLLESRRRNRSDNSPMSIFPRLENLRIILWVTAISAVVGAGYAEFDVARHGLAHFAWYCAPRGALNGALIASILSSLEVFLLWDAAGSPLRRAAFPKSGMCCSRLPPGSSLSSSSERAPKFCHRPLSQATAGRAGSAVHRHGRLDGIGRTLARKAPNTAANSARPSISAPGWIAVFWSPARWGR